MAVFLQLIFMLNSDLAIFKSKIVNLKLQMG